jgi:predicted component of type VI protein secretion system
MVESRLLKLRLSLKGRPIKAYVFDQDCVLIGRNPDADIYLDNPSISRDHLKIERTTTGYQVVDLNSANGTFVNDRPVQRAYLGNEDVIRIGKFSLWVSLEPDRRAGPRNNAMAPGNFEGTTVLRTGELEEMMQAVREIEPAPPPDPTPAAVPLTPKMRRRMRLRVVLAAGLGFLCGAAAGGGALYYYLLVVAAP